MPLKKINKYIFTSIMQEMYTKSIYFFPNTSLVLSNFCRIQVRHGDLFLRYVVSTTNSTHLKFLRLRLNFNNNDQKCLKMLKCVDFKCVVLRCFFQRKQIVDFLNHYSKIFNSHFSLKNTIALFALFALFTLFNDNVVNFLE